MFYIREMILIILQEKNENFYLLVGNLPYFVGHRVTTELLTLNIIQMTILSLLLNYYNYSRGTKPRDLCVFWMLSSLITPISIGIPDKQIVNKLLTYSRKLVLLTEMTIKYFPYFAFIGVLISFSLDLSIYEIIFISFPHSILWTLAINYTNNIILWQLCYYTIIVYYLLLKVQVINNTLKAIKQKSIKNITKAIGKFNDIFVEISDYNKIYWSKFLAIYWILISFTISTFAFLTFNTPDKLNIGFRIIMIFIGVQFFMTLLLIIHYSSLLTKHFSKTFCLLNSRYTSNSNSIQQKLKVN